MPTYEYICKKCSKEFEEFQSISAKPLINCPDLDCDGEVKRLISLGGGFVLKGTGYYQTDFKNKDKPTPTSSTNKTDSKSETVKSAKTD